MVDVLQRHRLGTSRIRAASFAFYQPNPLVTEGDFGVLESNHQEEAMETTTFAQQIQDVFTRRVLGNKLVVKPVTYWRGFYSTQPVLFNSITYRPVEAVILSLDSWKLGPYDGAERHGFTIEITGEDNPFYLKGSILDRVSPNQLSPR
jgi:hypothetical protein